MAQYEQLAEKLRAAIERGDYAPGSTLPKQDEIAATEKVGVKTVRAAVNLLAAEGLVTPVRRRGTVVRAQPERIRMGTDRYDRRGWKRLGGLEPHIDAGVYTTGDTSSIVEDSIIALLSGDDLHTVTPRAADSTMARALDIAPGDPVEVRRFVLQDQQNITTRMLTAVTPPGLLGAAVHPVEYVSETGIFIGTLAAYEAVGFTIGTVEETLLARSPTPAERTKLVVPQGEPVVEVRRFTRQASGAPMEYAVFICRASYFEWTYRFKAWESPSPLALYPLDDPRKAL